MNVLIPTSEVLIPVVLDPGELGHIPEPADHERCGHDYGAFPAAGLRCGARRGEALLVI
jgi:hypothetical protein